MSVVRVRRVILVGACLLLPGCAALDSLEWLQWPAMIVTVAASWFVTSRYKRHRWIGFVMFLVSNALWAAWGLQTGATALVVLQAALALLNVVGIMRADDDTKPGRVDRD